MNMEAIKQAEFELDEIIEDENVSAELVEEAREIYEQLNHSKTYYRWLERLVASIRSEEIFEFLPKDPNNTQV